jgi:hypothetical protein
MNQPSEPEWAQIDRNMHAANTHGGLVRLPPYCQIMTMRALVGTADDIVASHTLLSPEPETVWKLWAFTAGSIAFVEAEYETDNYDFGEDDQRRQGNGFGNPDEPVSTTAWSRPVRTIMAFEIVEVRYASRNRAFGRGTSEFYPTIIKIAFSDETSTLVNVGRSLDDESKRQRWDAFVTAARQAAT